MPSKYFSTYLAYFKFVSDGSALKRESLVTAKAMSGLVPSATYSHVPIICWYNVCNSGLDGLSDLIRWTPAGSGVRV